MVLRSLLLRCLAYRRESPSIKNAVLKMGGIFIVLCAVRETDDFESHQSLGRNLLPDPYMNAEKAAAYLGGISPKTLNRWARENYVPAIPIGEGKRRLWRFVQEDLDQWMSNRKNRGEIKS